MTTSSPAAIPKTPQDITVSFLKQVLHEQPWSQHISDFSFNLSSLQGQCSDVVVFDLTYDTNNEEYPKQIVLKFASSGRGFVSREHLVKVGAYKKEVGFYKFLLNSKSPLLEEKSIPPIYYAEIDTQDNDQFLLIMGKSGAPMDQLQGFSIPHAKTLLRNWASVQARFWYTPETENQLFESLRQNGMAIYPIYYNVGTIVNAQKDYTNDLDGLLADTTQAWPAKWQAFSAALEHFIPERKMTKLQENLKIINEDFASGLLQSRLEKAFQTFKSTNKTLLHGDFRQDNMIINKEDNDNIQIIDFQAVSFGNCNYDLVQFLAQQFDDHSHAYELIQEFWNALVKANPEITKTYSLEQLTDDTKHAVLLQIMMMSFYLAVWKDMLDKGTDVPKAMGERTFDLMMVCFDRIAGLYTKFFYN